MSYTQKEREKNTHTHRAYMIEESWDSPEESR